MIKVSHFNRKPGKAVSIERMYAAIRDYLPSDIMVTYHCNRFTSQGIFKRLFDILRVVWYQGDVNHVLGDVHFLTYLMRRKKTILTIHDCVMVWRTQGIKRWLLWFFWIWLPSKRCQVIVAVSKSTREQLIRELKCHPDKIQVIYNPVLPEFKPTARLFNASMPRILHIGTTEHKNLIRHCAALEGINCELIVIGKLKESQRKALCRAGLNYTNLVNLSDHEMVDQYRQADMVLFASTYEGFGLPIIEAQAIGRPVITSNLWSMPEVAGNGACFVDPFNLESIRSGVLRVIGNPDYRNRLITRGFANVKRFDVRVIAEQYASLYRCVASVASSS